MRTAKVERKTEYFPIIGEVKATNDEKGITEGYLNFLGNIDFGDDRTMPGAFKRTIADSYARKSAQGLDFLWPYLWNHDYNILPPGGIFEANEDKKGLYIKTQYNMDTQLGRELYSSFKMGTMKKQSMGYKAIRYEYVKDGTHSIRNPYDDHVRKRYPYGYEYVKDGTRSIRNLLEVAIMEGSAVVFPMNDLADVTTVKRTFLMQKPTVKDFTATYQERLQDDWQDDLWNLWYALKSEIISAFQVGDSPVEDVRAALSQFSDAMLAYVQQGVDLGMVEALQPDDDEISYGWMSSGETSEQKAGRVISARNHTLMTKAIQGIQGHCNEMKSMLTAAQQQGYPQAMSADNPPQQKDSSKEDDAVSTHLQGLLASLEFSKLLKR